MSRLLWPAVALGLYGAALWLDTHLILPPLQHAAAELRSVARVLR